MAPGPDAAPGRRLHYARRVRPSGPLAARFGALVLGLALLLGPASARADDDDSTAYSGLAGIGAALSTLVYVPLKVTYAVGGTVISGLAYVWTIGDTTVAGPIFFSAIRGDYVVLPEHLEGRRDLEFVGPQY